MANLKLVAFVVTITICAVMLSYVFISGTDFDTDHEIETDYNPQPQPQPPPPPPPQVTQPSDEIRVDLTKNAILYNSAPVLTLSEDEIFNRRWYTVPGASFDGLRGLTLPDAFQFISNTFPQLTVRAVPIGEPISLEYRRDRVTVQYDGYNKRVISARIG